MCVSVCVCDIYNGGRWDCLGGRGLGEQKIHFGVEFLSVEMHSWTHPRMEESESSKHAQKTYRKLCWSRPAAAWKCSRCHSTMFYRMKRWMCFDLNLNRLLSTSNQMRFVFRFEKMLLVHKWWWWNRMRLFLRISSLQLY